MAVQLVMDHTGETRYHFNAADQASVADAQARFLALTGVGFLASKRIGEGKLQKIREFDPTVEETLFSVPLAGG
jgi:hypothetical protein